MLLLCRFLMSRYVIVMVLLCKFLMPCYIIVILLCRFSFCWCVHTTASFAYKFVHYLYTYIDLIMFVRYQVVNYYAVM